MLPNPPGEKRQAALRVVGLLFAVTVLAFLLKGAWLTSAQAQPSTLTERQRFGFVATESNWRGRFDLARLGAGWYVDTTLPACGFSPEGMEPAFLIPVHQGYVVDSSYLGPRVDNHPGALWLIGNEPDCIWQDNVLPEEYARIYRDLRTFIKARDPTSQVSPGGIVQPTPLRLEWLDRVLAEYVSVYTETMPVDVWNIHNAILNEQQDGWGAEIPPGINAKQGVVRSVDDNDNLAIFEEQIRAFRQWMADRGYAGYPLIVTEYGVLMPDDYGFDAQRVNAFMSATFDFFLNTTDPALGDPNDGGRLVQRWAWFSLDVEPWDPITGEGFNGNLFEPDTGAITAHGLNYASRTSSYPPLNYVDLVPGQIRALPVSTFASATQTISRVLSVEIANLGTIPSGSFSVTLEYEEGVLEQAVADVPATSSRWLTFTLTGLRPGQHPFSIWIDPGHGVAESTKCNNQVTGSILAPTDRAHLPLVTRHAVWTQPPTVLEPDPRDLLVSSWPFVPAGGGSRLRSVDAAGVEARTEMLLLRQGEAAQAPSSDPGSSADSSPGSVSASGFREFPMPMADSYPAQLALDAVRHVLWVTERDGNRIAAFDLEAQAWGEEYTIPTPDSEPWGLAVDESGDVWFAEAAADKIGRLIVASGTITEYPLTPGSEPWGVAMGSDAVWFTQRSGDKIAELGPSTGLVTEHVIGLPHSGPSGIAVGGNWVWFTLTLSDTLGQYNITTDHLQTFLRPDSRPQDLILTSQGNPWFTEQGANRIVLCPRSTLGLCAEVHAATPDSEPYGIAMEGDVAVWFTERAGNKLGRYTGTLPPSEYPLPTPNSLPTDIVVDGDGCAWYTAPGANRIGRFCLPPRIYLPLVVKNWLLGLGR